MKILLSALLLLSVSAHAKYSKVDIYLTSISKEQKAKTFSLSSSKHQVVFKHIKKRKESSSKYKKRECSFGMSFMVINSKRGGGKFNLSSRREYRNSSFERHEIETKVEEVVDIIKLEGAAQYKDSEGKIDLVSIANRAENDKLADLAKEIITMGNDACKMKLELDKVLSR